MTFMPSIYFLLTDIHFEQQHTNLMFIPLWYVLYCVYGFIRVVCMFIFRMGRLFTLTGNWRRMNLDGCTVSILDCHYESEKPYFCNLLLTVEPLPKKTRECVSWKIFTVSSCLSSLSGAKPFHCFSIHHWLVNAVQRSPFLKDIILTTGDSNFAIWKEDVMVTTPVVLTEKKQTLQLVEMKQTRFLHFKSAVIQDGPIILSPSSEQMCTSACWSLSRPAVFFIGKEDGSIEVWNLLEKTSEAAHVQEHVTNAKITCIKPWIASCKFTATYNHYVST